MLYAFAGSWDTPLFELILPDGLYGVSPASGLVPGPAYFTAPERAERFARAAVGEDGWHVRPAGLTLREVLARRGVSRPSQLSEMHRDWAPLYLDPRPSFGGKGPFDADFLGLGDSQR